MSRFAACILLASLDPPKNHTCLRIGLQSPSSLSTAPLMEGPAAFPRIVNSSLALQTPAQFGTWPVALSEYRAAPEATYPHGLPPTRTLHDIRSARVITDTIWDLLGEAKSSTASIDATGNMLSSCGSEWFILASADATDIYHGIPPEGHLTLDWSTLNY